MERFTRVAQVSKRKNLDGQVVCRSADNLPFLLSEGMMVHFVPPTLEGPRQAVVAEIIAQREGAWEVRFEGVDTPEDAEAICGCYCLASDSELRLAAPEAAEQTGGTLPQALRQMVGCTLVEEHAGTVGEIVEVYPGVAQSLLVVQKPDGSQALVPAVDAFLGAIDWENRTVHATLPDGLLELE